MHVHGCFYLDGSRTTHLYTMQMPCVLCKSLVSIHRALEGKEMRLSQHHQAGEWLMSYLWTLLQFCVHKGLELPGEKKHKTQGIPEVRAGWGEPLSLSLNKLLVGKFANMYASCIHGRYAGENECLPAVAWTSGLNKFLTGQAGEGLGLPGDCEWFLER